MKRQNFILPKIYDYHGDLTKAWYVYFSFFDSGTWKMVRFKKYGDINRQTTIDVRLKVANALATEYKKKLLSGYNPFADKEKEITLLSVRECIEQEIADRVVRLRKKSAETYKSKVVIFLDYLTVKDIDTLHVSQFTQESATEFLNNITFNRHCTPTTRNAYRQVLYSLFEEIKRKGLIEKNPFSDIKKIPETRLGKLPFSIIQKEKLKAYMIDGDPEMWLFVQFMYYCFIRPGELRQLKCGAIDIDNGQLLIDATISKNKKSEFVIIPPVLLSEIIIAKLHFENPEWYIFGQGRTPGPKMVRKDYFNKHHKKITRKFGMASRFTLYSWKHTGAVDAVRAGINIKEIQLQLRHADLQTTDIYLKSLGVKDMQDFSKKMPIL